MNAAVLRVQRHIFKRLKEVMRVGTSGESKRGWANGKSCPELGRPGQGAHGWSEGMYELPKIIKTMGVSGCFPGRWSLVFIRSSQE